MSSSSAAFSLDHLTSSPSEQLCYVQCHFCDTILAVGVPCASLFKTVTVRCGYCTNLLSVNFRGLLLPAAAGNQLHLGSGFLSPTTHHGLLDEMAAFQSSSLLSDQQSSSINLSGITSAGNNATPPPPPAPAAPKGAATTAQQPDIAAAADQPTKNTIIPTVNRPPEKRQRVPSAYNRFIKDEIQRIKAGNPDITHREAFSAAAKNWAHFPHIHFGLMPDQSLKKVSSIRPQEGGDHHLNGLYSAATAAASGVTAPAAAAAATANMGFSPF